jgi:predicted kinase
MKNPLLIIINGLPASGKTTLAKRLGADLSLPILSRDIIFETLYTALECDNNSCPPLLGTASFKLLYKIAGALLAAKQPLIIEQFFGRPELRTTEFLELKSLYDFEPVQILCKAEGAALLERYLLRMKGLERDGGLQGPEGFEQNKARMLEGELTPLALGGPVIEIDTTTQASFDYSDLVNQLHNYLKS